ncbi:hypothetical protein HK57_00147 [Aspergillus ustus]|uniref:Xylanolytic transcriptional activator regulatory domain-containing protein n=1 Tax=Aspergillus ustus TaxID=40382 RepID=A0A0C1EFD0_ASPUT|nr:hypothetical protein HK57_00147 [Aspergillus ustus]
MPDRRRVFKFVAGDSRKQPRRACESCRKRKRRCAHGTRFEMQASRHASTESTSPRIVRPEGGVITVPATGTNSGIAGISKNQTHGQRGANADGESWFVGNTDPEGALLIATRPVSTSHEIKQHDLGVWLQIPLDKPRPSLISCPDPLISSVLLSHVKEQCLTVLPSQDDMEALLQIYKENIHPIFPVLDHDAYQSMALDSPEKTLLSQSICIAVSRDRRAKQYLRLPTQPHMSHSNTSQSIKSAVTTALALGVVQDKMVLIQAMTLTSLFTQFSGDRQEPAELLSRAICHAQTIGLHHKSQEKIEARLFCCLYALDILTSACLGRPVQLHRRDFGHDLSLSIAAQEGCFQLFFRVIQLLDYAIEIYRPGGHSAWEGTFPSFEDLIDEVTEGLSQIDVSLIATIEVLYNAVAILSCHSTNLHGISRTRSSESHLRQTLSASRVTYIVGEEFREELSLFPFVPYAVALSLRASYHALLQSKAAIFRDRARRQLRANCRILRELGGDFYSASLMADLGERVINETGGQEGGDSRRNRQEDLQPYPPGDTAAGSGNSADVWVQDNNNTAQFPDSTGGTGPSDIGLFDPMSFLGIFDNFEHEIEAFGGMVN